MNAHHEIPEVCDELLAELLAGLAGVTTEPWKFWVSRFNGPIMRSILTELLARRAESPTGAARVKAGFDMVAHLARQRKWSGRTFGPGRRTAGVIDHIRKELREIEADPDDITEWIDVVILALDGAWRTGYQPQQIIDAMVAKQTRNEARSWPDWRTMPTDRAIEHERSGEPTQAGGAKSELSEASKPTHRHKKRGTEYVLVGIGKMQAEDWVDRRPAIDGLLKEPPMMTLPPSVDRREVAVYRSATDPTEIWVRPREEFEDGRFETLTHPPTDQAADNG